MDFTVSLGDLHWRVLRSWPSPAVDLEGLTDVFTWPDGRVAALCRKTPEVTVFSPQGEVLAEWRIDGMRCPHYASVGPDGRVYIADLDGHQVFVLDDEGRTLTVLGRPDQPRWGGPFNHPASACVAPDGGLFVADGYGNSCLHRFDAELRHEYTVGGPGKGPGQFSTPHAVRVLRDHRVLVVDRENHRIQVFGLDGVYRGEIGGTHKPMAVAEMADGSLLVTDHTPRLVRYASDGRLLGRCRTYSTVAHGLSVGADGSIYLAEMGPAVLTRLEPVDVVAHR